MGEGRADASAPNHECHDEALMQVGLSMIKEVHCQDSDGRVKIKCRSAGSALHGYPESRHGAHVFQQLGTFRYLHRQTMMVDGILTKIHDTISGLDVELLSWW